MSLNKDELEDFISFCSFSGSISIGEGDWFYYDSKRTFELLKTPPKKGDGLLIFTDGCFIPELK